MVLFVMPLTIKIKSRQFYLVLANTLKFYYMKSSFSMYYQGLGNNGSSKTERHLDYRIYFHLQLKILETQLLSSLSTQMIRLVQK